MESLEDDTREPTIAIAMDDEGFAKFLAARDAHANSPQFDLTAAAKELSARSGSKQFTAAARRLNEAFSARTDLVCASRLLQLASGLVQSHRSTAEGQDQNPDEAALAGAAIQQALLIYARIVTRNDDRNEVPLAQGSSAEVKAAHDRVVRVRHGGVGHFGYLLDHPNGPVASDRVLVRVTPQGLSYGWDYRRANYLQKNVEDLVLVVDHGLKSVIDLIEERVQKLSKVLEEIPQALKNDLWSDRFKVSVAGNPGSTKLYKRG